MEIMYFLSFILAMGIIGIIFAIYQGKKMDKMLKSMEDK